MRRPEREGERRFDRAPLTRPVPGQTWHRSVEHREALAPTSLGLRIPGGGPDGSPVVRGQVPSQRICHGSLASSHGVSQTPGASRRSITPASAGERKKGKGRTRRPKNKEYGQRSVGFLYPSPSWGGWRAQRAGWGSVAMNVCRDHLRTPPPAAFGGRPPHKGEGEEHSTELQQPRRVAAHHLVALRRCQ